MKLLRIEDVMTELNVGRATATRILNMKSCPTLPRKKNQKFLVPEEAFREWVARGMK